MRIRTLDFSEKLAVALLVLMAVLMIGSIWNQSATMDELAHIPAGYSYVAEFDYRLNPEHPPLAKALAGLSALIFARPEFPTGTKYWQEDVNGQWAQGAVFLYESGNDADRLVFWSRAPMIALALLLGFIIFWWTRRRLGSDTALLALSFYVFSPTVLAHSPLVTTDLAAAFGFFIGIIAFVAFLESPSRRTIVIAGAALGVALLMKFSLVLLAPVYGALIVLAAATRPALRAGERLAEGLRRAGETIVIGLIALLVVWGVYGVFTWDYPAERQYADTEFLLSSYGFRPAVEADLALIKNPLTRPFGEYFLGLLMVQQRAQGGNTAYFLGEVSNGGSRIYFPLLAIVKESLPLILLGAGVLLYSIHRVRKSFGDGGAPALRRLCLWIQNNLFECAAIIFIAVYWGASMKSPLNIGVRHVLPTFPFFYILIARGIRLWIGEKQSVAPRTWFEWLKIIYEVYIKAIPKYVVLFGLLLWMMAGTLLAFPHFLAYYNPLGGGTDAGYLIATDSNYDWGQDLRRLAAIVEEENIPQIAVDYFGGGSPRYYLGDKFEPWWSARGPAEGWFAISATFRQGAFGAVIEGLERRPEDSYEWLKKYEPVARAGKSIFIYRLPYRR